MTGRFHLPAYAFVILLACATSHRTAALSLQQDPGRAPRQTASAQGSKPEARSEERTRVDQGVEIPSRPGAISGATDSDLQAAIHQALRNEPTLAHDSLTVTVSANTIELAGTVGSRQEFLTAARIARSYGGSKWLVNHIQVRRPAPTPEAASPERQQPQR